MTFFMTLAMILWGISLYFKFETYNPTIESDGKYWVIRVGDKFVDYEYIRISPMLYVLLWNGDSAAYVDCRFPSLEEAKLYFKHVCNYTTEGKVYD